MISRLLLCLGLLAHTALAAPPAAKAPVREEAPFDVAKEAFLAAAKALEPRLSNERHRPQILDHGHPTPYVVVITHGLYDSPYAQGQLAEDLFKQGFNVVSPLLPGHWSKKSSDIDTATADQYLEVQDHAIATAQKLGREIIVIGHSTGGLLAFHTALKEKNVAAIILAAPAFGLTRRSQILTSLGTTFHISGNWFFGGSPDGLEVPYISPFAALAVENLIAEVKQQNGWPKSAVSSEEDLRLYKEFFRRNSVPVLMVEAKRDDTIRNDLADLLLDETKGPKEKLISSLGHADCGRFLTRKPEKKFDQKKWDESRRVEKEILDFVAKLTKNDSEKK